MTASPQSRLDSTRGWESAPEGAAALDRFLLDMERRLAALALRQRRRILSDLRDHLEEALLAEGLTQAETDSEAYLATLDPESMARALLRAESLFFLQRTLAALSASLVLGLLTAVFMRASGRTWVHALAFGAGHGFSVGFALFWFRDRWQGLRPLLQWASALGVGALAGVPWAFMLNGRFDAPMVFYGAVSGYLLERFSRCRRWALWVGDNLWITAAAFLLAGLESGWDPRLVGSQLIPWAMAFHLTLQGGIAFGLWVHRRIGLWFLERPILE